LRREQETQEEAFEFDVHSDNEINQLEAAVKAINFIDKAISSTDYCGTIKCILDSGSGEQDVPEDFKWRHVHEKHEHYLPLM
jgi:hypothetical protein